MTGETFNIAAALAARAAAEPDRAAVIFAAAGGPRCACTATTVSNRELDALCDRFAWGLRHAGVRRGDRALVLLRPGPDLVAVVFALLKLGAVPVLIDPGLARKAALQCVREAEPRVLIGIPRAHVLRRLFAGAFRSVRIGVTTGRRWPFAGASLAAMRRQPAAAFDIAATAREDEAAVAFTSGSTGIPKGVVYSHANFAAQAEVMRDALGVAPGGAHLALVPLFALFDPALGVTSVFPDMDVARPARTAPAPLVDALNAHGVTFSLGSPTIWKRVVEHCERNALRLPTLRRVFLFGAPVPPELIEALLRLMDDGAVCTPFGATEALPLTVMDGAEILAETAPLTARGAGVCVGRAIAGVDLRIIGITDDPISHWDDGLCLAPKAIGEIAVKGPVVTREYLHRPRETAEAKIPHAADFWHRMGDLGYLDELGRLWFCGRKAHRVETPQGLLLPVPCEAIFNRHPRVARTALVGTGPRGRQQPALVVESRPGQAPATARARQRFVAELLELGDEFEHTRGIRRVLFHGGFPVDARHNAKIQREKLAAWAETRLG